MTACAFITGIEGPALTPSERAFMREAEPWGFILFKRNVESPSQVARLTASLREAVGRDAPVLVDQEGGRVQRLGPPHWPVYPPGSAYGALYRRDPSAGAQAARLGARLIAADLLAVGIDVDCLPLADVPVSGADPIIGDRAYGSTAEQVAALAREVAEGLLAEGVLPVLKHIPGHGRATADSHMALPVVETDRATLAATDFAAFRPLADLPLGMTAHVVYTAFDPIAPATTSVTVIRDVIRTALAFDGLLMSDDISMGALSGTLAERACAAIGADCDVVLHCNGRLEEMRAVAGAVPRLAGAAARRAERALALRRRSHPGDMAALRREWTALMTGGDQQALRKAGA
ncbi:MAG: beta-N-acetylhexosaminidase [Hyphomicrobiales bacterium]|nr:beta-N-acetylhexosaminidase [Hyphomicrobiales bacterium]